MRREYLTLIVLALAAIACNLPVGVVATPTVAPTIFSLPSPSPTAVAILPSPTILPTSTFTPTATDTATATFTATNTPIPSATPSVSATIADTPTATFTFTPTATDTPTNTATLTPTFTDTAVPSVTPLPSATLTAVPSSTDTPIPPTDTPVPTATPTATFTALPSLTPTPLPTITFTASPPPPTVTPLPTETLTPSPIPPTATLPPIDLGIITPTLVPSPLLPTLVPSPARVQPTVGNNGAATITATSIRIPEITMTPIVIGPGGGGPAVVTATLFSIPAFTPTPIVLGGGGNVPPALPTLPGGVPRGARDSDVSSTGRRAAIDPAGRLTIDNNFVPVKHPDKRVTQVRWSPDGRWLAYVVQTPGAAENPFDWRLSIDDGLWVFDTATNTPYFVLRQQYDNPSDDPQVRVVDDILWAENNDAIMVTLRRHKGRASIIVGVGGAVAQPSQYANIAAKFNVIDVVGGAWLPDNQSVVVATSAPEQPARLGIVRIGGGFNQIADGAALGLWIQNPALLPDGRYAFLGKPAPTGRFEDNPGASLRLYVMSPGSAPVAISGILSGPVLLADWDLKASPPHVTVHVQTAQGISTITLTVR